MEYRTLGRSGLEMSEIGFGCGTTADLMISGTPDERRAAVAHALELGITYFDTAPVYGEGLSETHLGQALRELTVRPLVGTKVRVAEEDLADIAGAVVRSAEASLRRLGMDGVDVIHLHTRLATRRQPGANVAGGMLLSVEDVLGPGGVLEGFERLRQQGKTRAFGMCGFGGEVPAINAVIDSGHFDAILAYYNLLNPSAGRAVPAVLRGPDYGGIIDRAAANGMGAVILRVLAAGALAQRSLTPLPNPPPQGGREQDQGAPRRSPSQQSSQYAEDAARAQQLGFLVEEGEQTLAQAAIRFALMKPQASTVLVGFSERRQLDEAAVCSGAGPLSAEDMAHLADLYHSDFGRAAAS